jgi:O-antigen/teichoic acid export membrane protein
MTGASRGLTAKGSGLAVLRDRLAGLRRQPLFANAGYLWAVTLVGALAGFFFWGIAARLYSPEEVGTASAVISTAALLAGIAGLGVGMGLVRFLPGASQPARLLNSAFTFVALSGLLVAAVYLAGIGLWSPSLSVLRARSLYACGFVAYVVAATLSTVLQMAFVARRRAGHALAQTGILNGGRLLLIFLLAGMGAAGLVGSVALSTLVAIAIGLAVLMPRAEAGYRPRPDLLWSDLSSAIPYSLGNYLAERLVQTCQLLLPLLILEMLDPAASGYAYVAWMLGSVLASPGAALAGSAFAEGSHAPESLPTILSRAGIVGLALTAAGATIVAVGAPWLLRLFGAAYAREAVALLRWLAAAAPLVVLASLEFTRLRVQKRIGRLVLLSATIAVATIGLAAVLMPRHGIAASGVGWLLGNGVVAFLAIGNALLNHAQRARGTLETKTVPHSSLVGDGQPVVAAIPCHNEAGFIADVVRRARPYVDAVVVIDDGSADGTAQVAQNAGARVIRHATNLGPGAAARSCLQAGCDLDAGVLVTLDGDGQHDPAEIPQVVAPVLAGEADLVIGSRFLGGYNNVARYRRFGIDVITFLYNAGSHDRISDGQSCFRAYNRRALEALHITEEGFGFSVETLVQARNAGLRIAEASISCVYHEESHSMNPVFHGVEVALMVVKHRALGALGLEDGKDGPASVEMRTS